MNKGLRKFIYSYVSEYCENSINNSHSIIGKLRDFDILELLYKSNSGNEMAAMILAELLYHNEKKALEDHHINDALKLFFT